MKNSYRKKNSSSLPMVAVLNEATVRSIMLDDVFFSILDMTYNISLSQLNKLHFYSFGTKSGLDILAGMLG